MRKKLSKLVAGAITAVTLAVPVATFGNIGQAPTAAYASGIYQENDYGKYWGIASLIRELDYTSTDSDGNFNPKKFDKNKDSFKRFLGTCLKEDVNSLLLYVTERRKDFFGTKKPTFEDWLSRVDFTNMFFFPENDFIDRNNKEEMDKYYDEYLKHWGGTVTPNPLPPA